MTNGDLYLYILQNRGNGPLRELKTESASSDNTVLQACTPRAKGAALLNPMLQALGCGRSFEAQKQNNNFTPGTTRENHGRAL